MDKRDLPWVALIAVSFIFGLAVSWERWGNPLVDCGREMNQPLRLARGEMLYSDVRHIYGPLSPYINALLYKIFGPSLTVLYADGIFTAILILAAVYWLSRRLMGRAAAAATTLSVMWLCAFKQAGNYILPYSYSALHGCALGLVSLALLVNFLELREKNDESLERSDERAKRWPVGKVVLSLAAAGFVTGFAILAKTEMGLAALSAGIVTAALAGYPSFRRAMRFGLIFGLPVVILVVGVYTFIASRVGWYALSHESLLFFRNLPLELVYFNKRISGFDQPLLSITSIVGAAVRVGALAAVVGTVSVLFTWRKGEIAKSKVPLSELTSVSDTGRASYVQIWMLFVFSLLLVVVPFAGALNFEKGPYLAMPFLLLAIIGIEIAKQLRQPMVQKLSPQKIIILVVTVYALASLARIILRVRSGGAYSSYLLPASVIMFTYAWMHPFASIFRHADTRRLARNIAVSLLMLDVAITASLLSFRFRDRNTSPITTERGTIIAIPDLAKAMNEAITFINRETVPGEPVAVMPEGTSLNFFTDRPNPLREEITTPGYLNPQDEERAIRQLTQSDTRFVLVANRATSEFGAEAFGRDYCRTLMSWIERNFEPCAIFGVDQDQNQQIGDKTFFIRVYRKKVASQLPDLALVK
jgi:4-amino-4-deoxy-L-arabinose transferase-like glycosyltransferase